MRRRRGRNCIVSSFRLGEEHGADAAEDSFGVKTIDKAPKMSESTRIREAYFTEFAEKVQAMKSNVPIQLSGGMFAPSATEGF